MVLRHVAGRRAVHHVALAVVVSCTVLVAYAAGQGGKRLNNLVTELANLQSVPLHTGLKCVFTNPRNGWIYVRCTAQVKGAGKIELVGKVAGYDVVLLRNDARNGTAVETMRLMPKGKQTLVLRGEQMPATGSIVVRAMPETHYVRFPQEPRFPALGVFRWPWLQKNVLASVNTIVGYPSKGIDAAITEWTQSGRKFIAYGGLPHAEKLTGEQAFEYWYQSPGFQDPRLSGLIVDEFQGRQNPLYPAWIDGVRRLGDAVRGTGKVFYAYCGGPGMYTRPNTRKLVRAVFDSGFYMAWERYHHEMPTLAEARALMDRLLGQEMAGWQAVFPDCQRQMVLVLGIFATGPDLDVQPQVNYKVWMDMQMRYLATHPAFDGLYGVHWWYSGAATEELVRWQNALYRHYCIEGATDLLAKRFGWTYRVDFIRNPDFYDAFAGWTPQPAVADSMRTAYLERYARIQNRYWQRGIYPDDPAGNTYLWTKRRAERPNVVAQKITHLVPGKCYTVQMITADYQDIIHGRSRHERHAVTLEVAGAKLLPNGCYYSVPVASHWSHSQLPFKHGPAWFNHHRVMFRAVKPTAQLTITDWKTPQQPGGPIGQELMINYIQVQPYYESKGP